MNTTLYKSQVEALKEKAQNIESHMPKIEENNLTLGSKDIMVIIGIIGILIISMVGFLTWWLVT